jgi:hypothetical protein
VADGASPSGPERRKAMANRRPSRIVSALVAAVAAESLSPLALGATSAPADAGTATISRRAFHDHMRKLWEDHITWTPMFIVSFALDLPDVRPTTDRLLQNQTDIGDAIKPFYGRAAGDELTDLLRSHILIAADLLAAAKHNDPAAFHDAKHARYRNANHIARFLHRANPANWPREDLKRMMHRHLHLTLAEAADRLVGNFEQDIADADRVHTEILHMADMLSSGIAAQFPGRFS